MVETLSKNPKQQQKEFRIVPLVRCAIQLWVQLQEALKKAENKINGLGK